MLFRSIAAWANSARIEQTAPGTYAARLPNNRLVGVYNQGQGGWVESPGSADMDEQAVAEGRDATDAEHKKAMDTLFKMPDVVAMSKSLKRRDQDPEYDAQKNQEFQKRLKNETIGAGGEDASSMSDFNQETLKQKGINLKTFKSKKFVG